MRKVLQGFRALLKIQTTSLSQRLEELQPVTTTSFLTSDHGHHHSSASQASFKMAPTKQTVRQSPLVRFYDPSISAADAKGRTLTSILAWDDRTLEDCHDYIQFLFPLPEGSAFNWSAPIIDRATFEAFRSRPELQACLRSSLVRILRFYGFLLADKDRKVKVLPGRNFSPAYKNWVKQSDHNHLRITRIIRSLRVLGLEEEVEAFFAALTDIYTQQYPGRIGSNSMKFWTRAAMRPLYLAPEDDEDEGYGADFLYEYEKGQEDTCESDEKPCESDESCKSDEDASGNQEETSKDKGKEVESPKRHMFPTLAPTSFRHKTVTVPEPVV